MLTTHPGHFSSITWLLSSPQNEVSVASPPPSGMPESRLQDPPRSTTNWPRGGRQKGRRPAPNGPSAPGLSCHSICAPKSKSHLTRLKAPPQALLWTAGLRANKWTLRELGIELQAPSSYQLSREPRSTRSDGFTLHVLFFLPLLSLASILICHSLGHTQAVKMQDSLAQAHFHLLCLE